VNRLRLAIDPDVLLDYLPYKTELDIWNGICYVSLVGFLFKNTRMLGVKIPFHVNFEEVNLRFYVRYREGEEWKRGVVFVKEIVPRPALSLVANTLYREHYQTLPMRHYWEKTTDRWVVQYHWKHRGRWQHFNLESELEAQPMAEGSEEEFITEHYWGYTRIGPQKTYEYQVTHPRWEVYPVINYDINVDFGALYDERFSILNETSPKSVMLAEGSAITVENKKTIQ